MAGIRAHKLCLQSWALYPLDHCTLPPPIKIVLYSSNHLLPTSLCSSRNSSANMIRILWCTSKTCREASQGWWVVIQETQSWMETTNDETLNENYWHRLLNIGYRYRRRRRRRYRRYRCRCRRCSCCSSISCPDTPWGWNICPKKLWSKFNSEYFKLFD